MDTRYEKNIRFFVSTGILNAIYVTLSEDTTTKKFKDSEKNLGRKIHDFTVGIRRECAQCFDPKYNDFVKASNKILV